MKRLGNYKIGKQIGEGGFGRVFQAEHRILGERACVKRNIEQSPDDVELLRREAKLLWKLHEYHSIPSVRDFFVIDDNNAAMVMSFIEGKTLDAVVENNGPIHPEDVCWITERLLGALYYAHYNGVVHSDVKPENIFVESDKHDVKLFDFGLATYRPGRDTSPNGYTPRYAAPELMQGRPPIPETDLYGAGITMLYALGGDVAKKGFRPDTPEEIVEFCNRLLLYDPRERPNWDDDLVGALGNVRETVFGRRRSGMPKKLKGGKR